MKRPDWQFALELALLFFMLQGKSQVNGAVDYRLELQRAFDFMAHETYTCAERIGAEFSKDAPLTSITMQRRNEDGTTFRLVSSLSLEGKAHDYGNVPNWKPWVLAHRTLYDHSGKTTIYTSRFGTWGIRMNGGIPRTTLHDGDTVTGKETSFKGRGCWLISVRNAKGWVNEYTIDKTSGFIFSGRSYNDAGRLMLGWTMEEVDLSPNIPDSAFDVIPKGMKLFVADDADEELKYDQKIHFAHSAKVAEYRESRQNGGRLPWHRRLWGKVRLHYDTLLRFARMLALGLAAVCIPLAIWLKIRRGKDRWHFPESMSNQKGKKQL